jgi:hypothetical protein
MKREWNRASFVQEKMNRGGWEDEEVVACGYANYGYAIILIFANAQFAFGCLRLGGSVGR